MEETDFLDMDLNETNSTPQSNRKEKKKSVSKTKLEAISKEPLTKPEAGFKEFLADIVLELEGEGSKEEFLSNFDSIQRSKPQTDESRMKVGRWTKEETENLLNLIKSELEVIFETDFFFLSFFKHYSMI